LYTVIHLIARFFKGTDVHYGMFAHQSIAWSVAFSFLEMLSSYCDDEYRKRSDGEDDNSGLRNAVNVPILPPPLTKELLLKTSLEHGTFQIVEGFNLAWTLIVRIRVVASLTPV